MLPNHKKELCKQKKNNHIAQEPQTREKIRPTGFSDNIHYLLLIVHHIRAVMDGLFPVPDA